MSAADAAVRGRQLIESQMKSTCTIRESSTAEAMDPDTGQVTPVPGAVAYSGKCRVRPAGTRVSVSESGGTEVFTFDYLVSLPFAATGVREAMVCTIDSSPDPALVGTVLQVQQVDRGEDITARRLACNEVK